MFAKKDSAMMDTKYEVTRDSPWPQKQVEWPHSRDLAQYTEYLLSPLTFQSLSESPQLLDILFLASLTSFAQNTATEIDDFLQRPSATTPIVVDIGLGSGRALNELKSQIPVTTVGIGLHETQPENAATINLLCYSEVAHGAYAQALFQKLRGKVALVCDVFGAATYAGCNEEKPKSTPIEALIYSAFLLSPGGQARIILSGIIGEHEDLSPIGFANQRQRLVELMQSWGFEIHIARTFIKSKVVKGSYSVDFHVTIKRSESACIPTDALPALFKAAETYIGIPSLVPKNTTLGEFGSGFGLRARTFTRPNESVQIAPLSITQAIESRTFRFAQDQYPQYGFQFKTSEGMANFIYRFKEYYINSRTQPDWTLTIEKDRVHITYVKMHSNRLEAKRESQMQLERAFAGILSTAVGYASFHNHQPTVERPLPSASANAWSLTGAF